MRLFIYNLLVNRKPGIRERYHRYHDNSHGLHRVLSYLYLLWLNLAVYILQLRFLAQSASFPIYEKKRLLLDMSESERAYNETPRPEEYVKKLSEYDVISFDMFDTLILRPFSDPTDLFYEVGKELEFADFHDLRIEAEIKAREKTKSGEITISDIYRQLSIISGITGTEKAINIECSLELRYCRSNPFMKLVWDELLSIGKRLIITTDMYLPRSIIEQILKKNGFTGYSEIYLSNEYHKSKARGDLYDLLKGSENSSKIIHVGDNPYSDARNAKKHNIHIYPYPAINRMHLSLRPYDMSPIIGGAYRGIIANRLYTGSAHYSMDYEYGYAYGGLFVLGYCDYIHNYASLHSIDHILFLSRDGEILKQVYDSLYPNERTSYVLWSRRAATICSASLDRHDFIRRFVYHKIDGKTTVRQALKSMGSKKLIDHLSNSGLIELDSKLTPANAADLRGILYSKWSIVLSEADMMCHAAGDYYRSIIDRDHDNKVLAVDIGWAGSGAMALRKLFTECWGMDTELIGMVAGTNTVHNSEPYSTETFLRSGCLVSYMYDQEHNRDLLKKHDPNRDYNLYWELLLSSDKPSFRGFDYDENGDVTFLFGEPDPNPRGINDIRQGIMDFIADYINAFGNNPFYRNISGRDAYAPMLIATSHNEAYLKKTLARYHIEPGVV